MKAYSGVILSGFQTEEAVLDLSGQFKEDSQENGAKNYGKVIDCGEGLHYFCLSVELICEEK